MSLTFILNILVIITTFMSVNSAIQHVNYLISISIFSQTKDMMLNYCRKERILLT